VLEVDFGKGFCEDVGGVLFRGHACYSEFAGKDLFAREMVFNADVFGVRMPYMIFGEARGCVVVAEKLGRRGR